LSCVKLLAIYPIGTKFDKKMLKEHRGKVVEIEIKDLNK